MTAVGLRYVAVRLLSALVTLLGVSILIFAAVRALPGDYAQLVLGPLSTAQERAAATARFGLDDPLPVQYLQWLRNAVTGDFGTSLVTQEPVSTEFAARVPVTLTIALLALAATVLVGIPLGVVTGVRGTRGGAGRLISSFGLGVPEFVLGSLVVFLFSRYSLGLSVGGYVPWSVSPGRALTSLLLPALVLAVFCVAATARITADSVRSVRSAPHVRAALGRGESPASVVRHHVLRNAAVPVVTLVSTLTAYLLGGAVIVEQLFAVPGLGSYLVQGLNRRDYAVVQTGVLLAAVVFVAMSLLVELAAGVIDPRLRAARTGAV